MAQFRKSIKVIDKCTECPCHTKLWWGDPKLYRGCNHKIVKNIYKRILEYYPETWQIPDNQDTSLNPNEPSAIAFSENDIKEMEVDGFPYWCPLDRSK